MTIIQKGELMGDLISRQDAINVADAVWSVTGDKNVAKVWDQIKDLPSAQPECDDTVSRKAEIDAIKRYIRGFDAIDVNFLDGLKTAIQIIEQLPHEYSNAQNTLQRVGSVECEDAVSRQAAIDACLKGKTDGLPATNVACDCCAERIRVLPSADIDLSDFSDKLWKTAYERGKAEAERHGTWSEDGGELKCSECHSVFFNDIMDMNKDEMPSFCPVCGARMDGEHNG